jgi:type VI secretion system secreted protein VgrG
MSFTALWFESGESSLSVRHVGAHEAISGLFSVTVHARSTDDDIDLEAIIGKKAELRVATGDVFGLSPSRRWSGVCASIEQVEVEPAGLSTYLLRIVPQLWLLTERTNYRVFQHMSIPDMVDQLLSPWGIDRSWRIERPRYPKLELRAQYRESDFSFFSRLLEEAGISFWFEDAKEGPSTLVLADAPETRAARAGGPLPFLASPPQSLSREHVTGVRLARQVRAGKVTVRDHDFRRSPEFALIASSGASGSVEDQLERFHFAPGSFSIETDEQAARAIDDAACPASPTQGAAERVGDAVGCAVDARVTQLAGGVVGSFAASMGGDIAGQIASKLATKIASAVTGSLARLAGDDHGFARADEKAGAALAQRRLESLKGARYTVDFATNALDLSPGTIFSVSGHARRDLGPDRTLLVTEQSISVTPDRAFTASGRAAFADAPHRPMHTTPKPRAAGPQTAVIVGPPGEEIHTDELGRVRVQFHWDREGTRDDKSSCWMRLVQGWAGSGYGMLSVPRVGQEVLVAFLEGDPDQPIVVGTVFNKTSRTPHVFPQHKSRSSWRSSSTPGGDGFNEITFEDAKGREFVFMHAERDMQQVIRKDRGTVVGAVDTTLVGQQFRVAVSQPAAPPATMDATGIDVVDRRIRFTTGEASITLDGPDVIIEAKGKIIARSSGDDVILKGGPFVRINCAGETLTVAGPPPNGGNGHPGS